MNEEFKRFARWMAAYLVGTGVVALLLGFCAGRLSAQEYDDVRIFHSALAQTFCFEEGDSIRVYSTIRLEATLDTEQLDIIRTHELVHQADMRQDRRICRGDVGAVLATEVHAYCVSDQKMLTYPGHEPWKVYANSLSTIMRQFRGYVEPNVVARMWEATCAHTLLGVDLPPDPAPRR